MTATTDLPVPPATGAGTRAATGASAVLDPAFRIGPIDRRLFGSFVEHMGRCVYAPSGWTWPGARSRPTSSAWASS